MLLINKPTFLKINGIGGIFYPNTNFPSNNLIIYATGVPLPPDNGTLSDAPFILNFKTDLFVPDYIGYGRSEGIFTPMNCVNTFLLLFNDFSNGCIAKNSYLNLMLKLRYKHIVIVGRSFGGMYTLLLPKFNKEIINIGAISPILDYVECGNIPGEETTAGFMRAMNNDGYKHLFRGINSNLWKKHFYNLDDLQPFNSIQFYKHTKIFLGHGKKDNNINFIHTVRFFEQLNINFPKNKDRFKLELYSGDHGAETSNRAIIDCLKWFGLSKQQNYS